MSFFDDDKKLENTEDEQYEEEIVNEEELDDDEYEYVEVDEDEELEDGYEYVEVDENGNEIVSEQTNQPSPEVTEENTDASKKIDDDLNPPQLANIQLEYAYLGLLFNNPKGISVYYFTYDECFFSTDALENLYKIILFQDGEKYAPPQAKDKFNLPLEDAQTYDLKLQLKGAVSRRNFSLEHIYTELKKLFTLKKAFLNSPTKKMQDKILEIASYELYKQMSVEEVENAIEQITVTNKLSQAVLNENVTSFLLAGESNLTNGLQIPFRILSTVFKGLRKGETMSYAMPSNSGKSRFTVNLAAYLAFVQNKKVLIISNEMTEDKMKLCLITTILNNAEIQELHGQKLSKTEGELLELKFRPDEQHKSKVKLDKNGFILKEDNETNAEFTARLETVSTEFKQTILVTEWLAKQIDNSIYFIHVTEHSNEDLRKIILNYYYKENIEYAFYDTMKTEIADIRNGEELKKTATVLSTIAQKFKIFIASSLQLLESTTLPVNLTINDMSASKTVKEVLDTLCLIKQINNQTLSKYEYSLTDDYQKCYDLEPSSDPDVRYYACVVDKNRAGAKPTVLFRLNLAYNHWEELGYLRLKQEFVEI
ncbi:MAG: hypothetical protein OSJ66_05180 [Clostridia bacterium]|nr:hypothetical protein [Clostridia bacterium]